MPFRINEFKIPKHEGNVLTMNASAISVKPKGEI